ncbi:hypothetical protein C8A01DRAFT_13306 [Parachaetomium inaequale]|uniref:Uncharacterized protein n=1 Tax=Parachaetomium inaequale TaxID=2588326 RepID=A0AAN6PNJ6_9PEZI|nr:hypothetical protein C8A01DRAFT_13306 [Parachaetomium inaequale]
MPPFPDTSPKEPAKPAIQARTADAENKSLGVFSKGARGIQTSAAAMGLASDPKPHTSPPVLREYIHNSSPQYEALQYTRQAPLASAEEEQRGRHHNHAPPLPGDSHHSAREPTDRTRSHMVNRPLREVAHARPARSIHRARPESRSSNVSKQRSRCGSLASSPLVRQRRVNISHEFTTGMAGVINQFTQQQSAALEEQKSKYHKYIKRLKRDLADESGVIARQISQIDAQANKMKELQGSKEQMASELKGIEAKLGASEDRARRLEEKYRACKTHLNSAIQEQQDLYTRSKKQWEEAIEQIDNLTQHVEEKEAELSREREAVRSLSTKLQDLQATSSGFEALAVQGKEILQKLGEQQTKAEEHHQKSAEEFRVRLDAIATRLETLSNTMSGQPDVLCGLRKAQDESLKSVTAKLDNILESRDASTEATSQLTADLERHTGKIWQRLDNQLESLGKQLAEKAEENGMVSTLYKRKDDECREHLKELEALRTTTEKQADQIHELEGSLVALDADQDESEEMIRELGKEAKQLREALKSKAAAVTELQDSLNAKDTAHASELRDCRATAQKLAQSLQEKEQSSVAAAQHAVETARREVRFEMERVHAKTEKSLQEMTKHRDSLATQVEKLKQQVHEKEQNESRDASTISSLQERLAMEEARGKAAAEQLVQRSTNLEQLENQLTARVEALETELKTTRNRAVDLEGETQRERTKSEALISGLKRWAQQEGLQINGLDDLGDGNKSADEISTVLARALSHVSLSRGSQTAIPEAHPGDVSFGGENSKFFSSQSSQSPRADLGNHTRGDRPTKEDIRSAVGEHPGTGGNAAGDTSSNDPLSYASTLHHMRRVVVRSPANVPHEPAAPSIDQEKMRRREAVQPKSIMKRVTRSTSRMLRPADSDAAAGHGAFKRSRQDELLLDSTVPSKTGGRRADTGTIPVSDADATESTSGTFSKRPSKRRRSETARPDNSVSPLESSRQGIKREPSRPSMAPKTKELDSKGRASDTLQHGEGRGRSLEKHSNLSSSYDFKSIPADNSRRNSGSGSQGLRRTPSANTVPVLGLRHTNVRTYGSQKAPGESSIAGGQFTEARFSLRSQLRSQSQSRYWPPRAKEESQESITFSQGVGADENFLLPFQA